MKRLNLIAFIMILLFVGGCGKKEPPTMGIGYCYLDLYDDTVEVICPDGSVYKCHTGYTSDLYYNDGKLYYAADNLFTANIKSDVVQPLIDEATFKKISDDYRAYQIAILGDSGKVALQLNKKINESPNVPDSVIYIISDGSPELLCETDDDGVNGNNSDNSHGVGISADKNGDNLFVKQNNKLVEFNIQNKTATTLISDFKYEIFDVDAKGDRVAYIYKNNIYLYEIKGEQETQIGELEFPVGKIRISDDGNWIMVMDTTSAQTGISGLLPGPGENVIYIFDCATGKKNKVVEGGCGSIAGGFDFAE